MSVQFDYKNQAWVENGVYVRCGHPESMECGCFGRAHAGELVNHQQDSDCDVDVYGECVLCGVLHGEPCPVCGGKGFHQYECVAISPSLTVQIKTRLFNCHAEVQAIKPRRAQAGISRGSRPVKA